jgi:hypothetical protein
MDSERQLRAEVVRALEAVTPPAPWLASAVGESVRARARGGGRKMVTAARFTARGIPIVVAVALVLLIGAAAVGIFALRSVSRPVPAHPSPSAAVRYAQMLQRDHQLLNQAAGREVAIGVQSTSCDSLAHTECPAYLTSVVGAYQRWLDDLDRTSPPAPFAAEHARMKADVTAVITFLNLGGTAFNAGDAPTMNLALTAALVPRDELLATETEVVYESQGGKPARYADAVTSTYTAMLAHDYDKLQLARYTSSLSTCKVSDGSCAALTVTQRGATQAFLADLQAGTPPARFAGLNRSLITAVGAELQTFDQVDAAYASGDQTTLHVAKIGAVTQHNKITTYVDGMLYAR